MPFLTDPIGGIGPAPSVAPCSAASPASRRLLPTTRSLHPFAESVTSAFPSLWTTPQKSRGWLYQSSPPAPSLFLTPSTCGRSNRQSARSPRREEPSASSEYTGSTTSRATDRFPRRGAASKERLTSSLSPSLIALHRSRRRSHSGCVVLRQLVRRSSLITWNSSVLGLGLAGHDASATRPESIEAFTSPAIPTSMWSVLRTWRIGV